MHNLRMAFRSLTRTPIATALIVCLLGLGLGAAATIFSLFDAVLLRPLPVAHPEQLVRLVQQMPKLPPRSSFPYPFYAAFHDHMSTLQFVFGETDDGVHLRMTEPSSEQISVHAVTPEFFTALGVKPFWGRMLLNDDHAAVLSYPFWRRHFPDNPKTLAGKTLVVNGQRLAIVGVMPREFNGLSADTSPDIRIPLNDYFLLTGYPRDKQFFELSARLKPGQTESSAQSECLALWNSTMRDYYLNIYKESSQSTAALLKRGLYLEPLAHGTSVLRDRMGDVLKLLMAAAAVLVLIIGLNVAGLLVARTAARQQEMAVKLAMGASTLRLAAQLAFESLLLAILSAAAAICVALVTMPLALRLVPPVRSLYTTVVPITLNAAINGRVLLFLALITIGTAGVFTISPVLTVWQLRIDSVLRSARSGSRLRGRQLLIAGQIALCMFLLVCASQLARSFQQLQQTPSGFARDSIATFTCDLAGYKNAPAFVQKLEERILQLPGVVSVATSSIGVMREHGMVSDAALAGHRVGRAEFMATNVNNVSPGYFSTMGMRIIAGRDLALTDTTQPNQPAKALVNEEFVRRFLGNVDPLGRQFGNAPEGVVAKPDFEIVGVVSDTKYRSLKDPVRPMYFTRQADFDSFVLNVRTNTRPEAIIGPVRQVAASVAPDLPFLEVNTLAREVSETTAPERATALLSSLFGLVASLIAGVGTYGLLIYSVRQRRREIGIRMAIGAQQSDVVQLIARQTLLMTLSGVAAGLGTAVLTAPALRSLLYGLSPGDPASFLAAGIFVAFVAAIATIAPVFHATRIKPAEALRIDA